MKGEAAALSVRAQRCQSHYFSTTPRILKGITLICKNNKIHGWKKISLITFLPHHVALLLHNLGARWGGWSSPRPGRFTCTTHTRYSLYRGLDGPNIRSEREQKNSTPPEFDPQTVQPTERRYTDWSIPAPYIYTYTYIYIYYNKHLPLKNFQTLS